MAAAHAVWLPRRNKVPAIVPRIHAIVEHRSRALSLGDADGKLLSMQTGPILIAGAGAVGSIIGGMLRASGHQVALLGRPDHLEAIARRGLNIDGMFGHREVHGFELFHDFNQLRGRKFGLIVIAVKSYDTAPMAALLPELLGDEAIAVSAQNGLGNIEIIGAHLGPERVLSARVIFGAEIEKAGKVRVTVFAEPVAVGPAPDLSGAATPILERAAGQISAMLAEAGIPTRAVADIRPWLWTKLFYNAALNPLGALLKTHYGALGDDPELRRIMDAIVEEAFAAAQASGVQLPYRRAADYLAVFYNRLLPVTYDHRPSMLSDLEHRGRTEIGALNGKVVEIATRLGLQAEMNRTMAALIRARERGGQGKRQEDR
jgi:2-dehydropantoate 2-reductase